MSKVNPAFTTYVFLDVVRFSTRTVEVQAAIVEELNAIVLRSLVQRPDILEDKKILIPTGDGICIALQANEKMAVDVHMWLALDIIKQLHASSQSTDDYPPKFSLCIGIDSNNDVEVLDVNGNRNMAGAGINMAQRIMSLADENQIIVSQVVYSLLRDQVAYPQESFRQFDTIVKHDKLLTVHQYIEEKHVANGLNIDVPSALETPDIRKVGRQCKLLNIYPLRNEQVYRDLRNDIEKAQRRVWMSGVGLSVVVRLNDLLPLLVKKSNEQFPDLRKLQIRLMLLDAVRTPAVFRTFLESSNEEFQEFLAADQRQSRKGINEHPYFKHQLFLDFNTAYNMLDQIPTLKDAVRFPPHNPNCWLVIVDDVAYFQPYTFGGKTDIEQGILSIGHLMPVFKFQAGAQTDVFSILEDHFNKLWATTDVDLFHIGAHLADRVHSIALMFRTRKECFKNVYGALHPNRKSQENGDQERVSPRQPCLSPNRTIETSWIIDGHRQSFKSRIENFSRFGVLLEPEGNAYPDRGEIVDLDIVPKDWTKVEDTEPPTSDYLKAKLIKPTKGKFIVTRVERRHDSQRERMGQNPIRVFVALKAY